MVLEKEELLTPDGYNTDELQKPSSKGKMVHSKVSRGVTHCIEHSRKSKAVETEDPLVGEQED